MSENFTPIDDDEVARLLALAPRARKKKYDDSYRDITTWFELTHYINSCENPECLKPPKIKQANMVVNVHGVDMCRYCYLGGYLFKGPDNE